MWRSRKSAVWHSRNSAVQKLTITPAVEALADAAHSAACKGILSYFNGVRNLCQKTSFATNVWPAAVCCSLQIIASAAHVCLYRMSVNEQQWVRHGFLYAVLGVGCSHMLTRLHVHDAIDVDFSQLGSCLCLSSSEHGLKRAWRRVHQCAAQLPGNISISVCQTQYPYKRRAAAH